MARATRIAAWVVGGLAAVVALAAIAVVALARSDWLLHQVARRAGEATGREVAIGALDIDFGRVTRVHLNQVRIGNPGWARERDMARVEALDLAVRVWPLLRGRLELDEVTLTRPHVALEKHPDGRANWTMGPKQAPDPAPENRAEFPIVHRLVIDDGRLAYHDPANRIAIESRIHTATGGDPANRQVSLDGTGSIGGQPTRLSLVAGSLLELRDGKQPYPVRLDVRIGATQLRAEGTIAEPVRMTGLDLRLLAAGPDLAALTQVTGVPLPRTRPYRLEGTLLRQGGSWTVRDFAGTVGDSDLSGGATLVVGGQRPTLRANLESDRLALADLAGLIGGEPGEKDVTKAPDRVLPAKRLALDQLDKMDMNVRFTGRQVEAPGLPITGLDAQVMIENGHARFDPLAFAIAQGAFAGTLDLDSRGSAAVDMTVRQVDLRRFLAGTRFAPETSGTLAGLVQLSGRGRSTADLLAGADGKISLMMTRGSLSNLLLEAAGLDLAEALGFVLTKDKAVPVRCLVADFAVQRGIARSRALVLDTTDTVVTGTGAVDFASEDMKLRFEAHPKDPSPLTVRTPVEVGGKLGHPQLSVDATGPAARGGLAVALGALLTPLAAIIPFLEPGLGRDQPCGELIQQAQAPE